MKMDTLYLILAAGLIFGAGAVAAKKILRQLTLKQMLVIAPIAVAMVLLIWMFLAMWTKQSHDVQVAPAAEPKPLLRPDQD
jgi:drug/metabolite transporter (DMT)-like permease